MKKILKFDPIDEEVNCLFMNVFAAQNDKKSLTKHYERYMKILKKEWDISPESTIINLYEKLVKSF